MLKKAHAKQKLQPHGIAGSLRLEQAQTHLRDSVSCDKETEIIQLANALGRVASVNIESELAIPPSDNSAMDGFAVRASDLNNGVTRLPISQRVPAGAPAASLDKGTAARIFTGATMPDGADAVVIQENCEFDSSYVSVNQDGVSVGDNIRPLGQDIPLGATVISKGQKLSAVDLSLLSSIGCTQLEVFSRLKVAVFSTGNELVEPGQTLNPGQIYNSNRTLLMALCTQLGYQAVDCGIVEDTFEATKAALLAAASEADIIISSGGVSVGEEDHVKPAAEALGSLALWKVRMKPGKPVAFGDISGVPFLGLPGNPVSSYVVFQLLGVPVLQTLQGQKPTSPTMYSVVSSFSKTTTSREEYIRVRLSRDERGQLRAERFANLSSGVMSSLSWADGLVRQRIDQAIDVGQMVDFLPLTEGML